MKNIPLLICGLILLLPLANAQQPGGAVGDSQQYAYRELSAISGIITASTMEVWFTSPISANGATDVSYLGFNVAGPDIPTGGTATFTASTIATNGCSVGSWTTVSETLAAGTGATSYAAVTLSSIDCSGIAEMLITAGAVPVTLGHFRFPFNIHVIPTAFTNTLSGSISTAVTGSLSVTESGTINVVNSGGQNIAITSWPSLLAALSGGVTITDDANGWAIHQDALSGTVNVVNSGGQNIAVTSWPALLATLSGSINTAVSGSLTISGTINTVNSGGQTLTIASWPNLLAALSGNVTIHDDSNGWAIHQDPLSGTINVVTSGGQDIAITSWPELISTIDILDDTTDDGMLTVPVSNINATFDNATFNTNTTNESGLTTEIVKGNVMLILFILAVAIAEWKKDAIYHLIAALIGALTMSSTVDNLGVPRLIILAVVIYQLWRMFSVMGNNRNNIQGTNT